MIRTHATERSLASIATPTNPAPVLGNAVRCDDLRLGDAARTGAGQQGERAAVLGSQIIQRHSDSSKSISICVPRLGNAASKFRSNTVQSLEARMTATSCNRWSRRSGWPMSSDRNW